jgi:hypothetical protein
MVEERHSEPILKRIPTLVRQPTANLILNELDNRLSQAILASKEVD